MVLLLIAGDEPAAVDAQDFTCNERCGIKEHHRVGDIAHLAHATRRMQCAQLYVSLRRVHRRLDGNDDDLLLAAHA
jgi:hypothetical protein